MRDGQATRGGLRRAGRATSALAGALRRHWLRAVTVAALAWLALAAAGGALQHAPQGWTVPVGQWHFRDTASLYWLYPWNAHWALVIVPAFLAKALPVAALAGAFAATAARTPAGECRTVRCGIAGGGLLAGIGGMLACCSPLALALAGLIGGTATLALTDTGLWLAGGLFALGALWQASLQPAAAGEAATTHPPSPPDEPAGAHR